MVELYTSSHSVLNLLDWMCNMLLVLQIALGAVLTLMGLSGVYPRASAAGVRTVRKLPNMVTDLAGVALFICLPIVCMLDYLMRIKVIKFIVSSISEVCLTVTNVIMSSARAVAVHR